MTLAPWKKSYDNLESILRSSDISLSTNVCLVKAMVFPVVMYACEIWTIKKAEYGTIDSSKCGAVETFFFFSFLSSVLFYFYHLN